MIELNGISKVMVNSTNVLLPLNVLLEPTAPTNSYSRQAGASRKISETSFISTLDRRYKTEKQLTILRGYFAKRQNWSRAQVEHIAASAGLQYKQVYKWYWDQRTRVKKQFGEDFLRR